MAFSSLSFTFSHCKAIVLHMTVVLFLFVVCALLKVSSSPLQMRESHTEPVSWDKAFRDVAETCCTVSVMLGNTFLCSWNRWLITLLWLQGEILPTPPLHPTWCAKSERDFNLCSCILLSVNSDCYQDCIRDLQSCVLCVVIMN